jgi:hypothetical protein
MEIDLNSRLIVRCSANMGNLQRKKKEALFKGKPDALLHLLRSSYHQSWSVMKQKARMH